MVAGCACAPAVVCGAVRMTPDVLWCLAVGFAGGVLGIIAGLWIVDAVDHWLGQPPGVSWWRDRRRRR